MSSYYGVPVYVGDERIPPQGMSTKEAIKKQGGTSSIKPTTQNAKAKKDKK